jgi:hypothetical protein
MTTTAAGADDLKQCFVEETHVCDKIPGRSYMPEFAYQRLDSQDWTTHSSTREVTVDRTGEVEVLRKILPVNVSASPDGYLNETVEVYRTCPRNISARGDEFVTVIGRNFQDRYSLVCVWRLDTVPWMESSTSEDLKGQVSTVGFWESKTRVRCKSPEEEYNGNQTWSRRHVHVSNNGLNFSFSSAPVLPVNVSKLPTDVASLTEEEKIFVEEEKDKLRACLVAVATTPVDDAYPSDEEGYRRDDDGWFLLQAMGMLQLTFEFGHLPEIMKYDEHYRVAIYVSPSVCQEQKCKPGGGRVRVPAQRIELDPPSELDLVTNDPVFSARWGTGKTRRVKSRDAETDEVTDMHDFDPLYDRLDNVLTNSLDQSPCTRPIPLSQWFKDVSVDKHGQMNISVWALNDVIVKPEIQILNGMFLTSTHFLRNITTVSIQYPDRANRTEGVEASETATRRLPSTVSFEERIVPMQYIWIINYEQSFGEDVFPPLNLPPTFTAYETGRVLSMFGRTSDGEDLAPVVLDARLDVFKQLQNGLEFIKPYMGVVPSATWWGAPTNSPFESLMMANKYQETFHGLRMNPEGTQPTWVFDRLALPYIPFISNCDHYDSYIPVWHIFENYDLCELPDVPDPNTHTSSEMQRSDPRRAFAPFPHQDEIVFLPELAPFTDGILEAVADICITSFNCRFEENLLTADVNPRWFESDGATLFQISQEAIEVMEFIETTEIQRQEETPDPYPDQYDKYGEISRIPRGGNNHLMDDLTAIHGPDILLNVDTDSEAKGELSFDCTRLCFPREVTFSVRYWQKTKFRKKLIAAGIEFDGYDRDPTSQEYEFGVDFQPYNWIKLMVAFAFSTQSFTLLFIFLSAVSTGVASLFYLTVRFTTRVETPPRFRFTSFWMIVVPNAMVGVLLTILPLSFTSWVMYAFVYGEDLDYMKSLFKDEGETYFLMDGMPAHWMITKIDPTTVADTRNARMGFAFIIQGIFLIVFGAFMYLPKRVSKREREIEIKRDKQAAKESVWVPTTWKRSNFVFASVMMGLWLVTVVEFSYWDDFGTYIWTLIIAFRPIGYLLDMITEVLLKEALLTTPLMGSFGTITGMVTLGADDFMDFMLGFLVDFLIMLSERTYIDPWLGYIMDFVIEKTGEGIDKLRSMLKLKGKTAADAKADADAAAEEAKNRDAGVDFSSGDTVEPILGAYSGYSGDAMGLPYALVPMLMMLVFADACKMMDLYGIKSVDMLYYIVFSIVIIPFQYISDILCLQVLELTHGWKIYDYLVYTRYRFLQRETRWKGLEDSLDECIEEGMRTLDQMCFSSQYYIMITLHTQAIVEFIFGIECMLRAQEGNTGYNIWGDTMTLPFGAGCLLFNYATLRTYMWLIDKSGIYRLKHEDTAWHSTLGGPDDDEFGIPRWDELDKIKGGSHEAYLMNQKITSETFRFRFLRYNRPWLVNQLPAILTPRTLRRSRPYLIAQLTKILGSANPDVSSDSDSDDDGRPHFGPVSLSTSSRSIARLWLAQARRRKKLREVVQPLISRARRNECEKCLSRKQLQVLLIIPIEVLGDRFEKEYPSEEFDKVAWKQFFNRNAKFQTLCLSCIQQKQELEKQKAARMAKGVVLSDSDDDEKPRFGPVFLSASATAMILKWKRDAGDKVRKRGGRVASAALISDDDEDDDESVAWAKKRLKLNAVSKALAVRWLRMARARSPAAINKNNARDRLPDGRRKAPPKGQTFGKNPRTGKRVKPSRSALRKK